MYKRLEPALHKANYPDTKMLHIMKLRENQIKALVWCYHTLIRIAKIKMCEIKKHAQARTRSNRNAHTVTASRSKLFQLLCKRSWQSLLKSHVCITCDPTTPLPGVRPQKCMKYVHLKISPMSIATCVYNVSLVETAPKFLSGRMCS